MGKQEKGKEKKVEPPPVQKVPDKNDLPEKPPKEKNPSGNKDSEPEEQISSE